MLKMLELKRKERDKPNVTHYTSLKIIGRGAFGEVRVCKDKFTNEIVAVKKIIKEDMILKN